MRTNLATLVAVVALSLGSVAYAEGDLVLHYTFEEGQGDVLQDHSGNNLHGKIHGARWVKGKAANALAFDGKDDYVECPYAPATNTPAAFSVEAWVYPERHGGGIFSRVTGGTWKDLRLSLTTFSRKGQAPYSLFCMSDGENHDRSKFPALDLNKWTHLAVTFDGTGVRLFVNGVIENRFPVGLKSNVENTPIWIGRSFGVGDRHYFSGMIRDVRYYNRALSIAEVEGHHELGPTGKKGIALARRTFRPPVVDGRLSEEAWSRAEAYRIGPIAAADAKPATHVRLLYDEKHLYVGFTCQEPTKSAEILDEEGAREGNIWNFDCVEVFLDPEGKRERYYHFAASPVRNLSYEDQTGFKGGAYQDELWHEPWEFACQVDAGAKEWTLEAAIPFESLGVATPRAGDVWLGNFGRERPPAWQVRAELYLWSQLGERFNDALAFGPISFERVSRRARELAAGKRVPEQRPPGDAGWADSRARTVGRLSDGEVLLPTEQTLKPAGKQITYPGRPLDMALSPNGKWAAVTNLRDVTLIDVAGGEKQIVSLPDGGANSFHGVVFLPDSRTFYCSGAKGEVFVFEIGAKGKLAHKATHQVAKRAACGLAFSDDRKHLYVADSVGNSLVVCDASTLERLGEVPVGVAPYSVAVGPDGKVYVSNWGGRHATRDEFFSYTYKGKDDAIVLVDRRTGVVNNGTVSIVSVGGSADDMKLDGNVRHIEVGRFPCQILLNASRSRLFVANANDDTVSIVDTASDKVLETVSVRPDSTLPFGSQPNALALSADETTLYAANATNNAIAVIRLGRSAGVAGGPEQSQLAGMIPTGWFPGALKISHDERQLYVANVRGLGAGFSDGRGAHHVGDFVGLVSILDVPDDHALSEYTRQVAENNRLQASLLSARPREKGDKLVPVPTKPGESSVFEHVIYIIKENHTYDMDLGDMSEGNGEPRLTSCGEMLTPNAHAIARQFVLLDNYHVPSVQSPTGHVWLSQGITTSYWEKGLTTWPRLYSYTGQDALAFAGSDFIWTNVLKHGLTFRNYGENVSWRAGWADKKREGKPSWIDAWNDYRKGTSSVTVAAKANIPSLKPHTAAYFPGYGYIIPDVRRAQIFIEDLKKFEQEGNLPNLIMIFLPNNHTSGSRPGLPIAPAQVADNDMALGMIVDAVSRSKFWPKTVIFSTEDDPWNGSDHVAGSRSLCFVASPYTKRGAVVSECYSLCGLLKTIELILGVPMMNQLDLLAEPMTECFTDEPDFAPYTCIPSKVPLDTLNPKLSSLSGSARFWAEKSMELPLMDEPDAFPEHLELFKRLAWYTIVGHEKPYTYVKRGKIIAEDPAKWVR